MIYKKIPAVKPDMLIVKIQIKNPFMKLCFVKKYFSRNVIKRPIKITGCVNLTESPKILSKKIAVQNINAKFNFNLVQSLSGLTE